MGTTCKSGISSYNLISWLYFASKDKPISLPYSQPHWLYWIIAAFCIMLSKVWTCLGWHLIPRQVHHASYSFLVSIKCPAHSGFYWSADSCEKIQLGGKLFFLLRKIMCVNGVRWTRNFGWKVRRDELTVVPASVGEWRILVPRIQCCWSEGTWRRTHCRQSLVD